MPPAVRIGRALYSSTYQATLSPKATTNQITRLIAPSRN